MNCKESLKEYIDKDEIYQDYKQDKLMNCSDFDKFCIQHCKDIEELLEENLEYITQKENINKEIEIGNWNKIKVLQYDKQNNLINEFESMQEASNKTNIANGDISRCCNNIRKTAGGFIWKKNYNQ